jgi:hypothetical protein
MTKTERLEPSIEIMRLLNKAQKISIKLHKLDAEESYLKKFDESIMELSLTPVDIIGDIVYLQFLKKHNINTISEPHQHGWYHTQDYKDKRK